MYNVYVYMCVVHSSEMQLTEYAPRDFVANMITFRVVYGYLHCTATNGVIMQIEF